MKNPDLYEGDETLRHLAMETPPDAEDEDDLDDDEADSEDEDDEDDED